jgi:hypothetical protein
VIAPSPSEQDAAMTHPHPTQPRGRQTFVIEALPQDRRTNLPSGAAVFATQESSWFMAVDGKLLPYTPPTSSGRGRMIAVLSVLVAIVIGIVTLVVVRTIQKGPIGNSPASSNFSVAVTGCEADATAGVAEVEVTVINRTDSTRSASIKVEYRDGSGARLDTDTVYVRNIAPHDTARSRESTFLDAPPAGQMTCAITEVD